MAQLSRVVQNYDVACERVNIIHVWQLLLIVMIMAAASQLPYMEIISGSH